METDMERAERLGVFQKRYSEGGGENIPVVRADADGMTEPGVVPAWDIRPDAETETE